MAFLLTYQLRYPVRPGLICYLLNIFCFVNSFQKCVLQYFRALGPGVEAAGVKTSPKPSFDRWGCTYKILSRSMQGFGFPLALHIPTDRQTDKQTSVRPIYLYKR